SGAVDLVKGVAILASDAGIVLVSSQIPDPIEPAFIKDKNDEIVEDYSNAAKQVIDNPLIVAEMFAQSVSDTVEEEDAMFATGEVLTGFIPLAGGLKYAKEGAVLKNVGKGKSGDIKNRNINENYTGGRSKEEFKSLSYDPAEKAVTDGAKREATIGLELEQKGKIGKIERSSDPKTEFIDTTTGDKIDIKSFES